jgi:serine/threonine protein kinase
MSEWTGKVLGNYHIIEQIGRGGMSGVFSALDLVHERTVAIKILAPQLAMEKMYKERFKREAKVLYGLEHPNIVPILDYGEAEGIYYIVMPLMEVGTLSDRLKKGALSVREGARILGQIASALQFAHDAGVVHRDVKPSNILIDEESNAWLSDFGFAYITDASMSLTGSALIGTPAYISPEQINGGPITHQADQYSLGVVLYQLCTGSLPYDAETPLAIVLKHAVEPLPRPRSVNPNLPDAVEAVLIKALAKDPAQRFDSIEEFSQAFRHALNQALDPVSGLMIPGAVSGVVTLEFPDSDLEEVKEVEEKKAWFSRRSVLALLLLLLFACPTAYLAFSGLNLGLASVKDNINYIKEVSGTIDLMATVNALSTANAPDEGTIVAPGQVETAVAGTLTAMVTESEVPQEPELTLPFSGTEPSPEASPSETSTWTTVPPAAPSNTPIPTNTPNPGVTFTSTSTSFVPNTPTQTQAPTLLVSSTATWTTTPNVFVSNTPTHTSTKEPTTIPAVSDPCDGITIGGFSPPDKNKVVVEVTNSSGSDIFITYLWFDWPESNDVLKRVRLGSPIMLEEDDEPPSEATWSEGKKKWKIRNRDSEDLEFEFSENAAPVEYSLQVTFKNSCTISQKTPISFHPHIYRSSSRVRPFFSGVFRCNQIRQFSVICGKL